MALRAVLTAVLVFSVGVAAFAACSGGDDPTAADGGSGGDGGGGGGGCESTAQCSGADPREAVCIDGACSQLESNRATLVLNLAFRNAPEIRDAVTAFRYYALHPKNVDGSTLTCEGLIGGQDPDDSGLNLIQTYRKELDVTGDLLQSGTLDLPYTDEMLLFVHVYGEGDAPTGLACTPGVIVPQESENGVGMNVCPADKTERCLELLPE